MSNRAEGHEDRGEPELPAHDTRGPESSTASGTAGRVRLPASGEGDGQLDQPVDLIFPTSTWARLQEHLFQPDGREWHAFAFCGVSHTPEGSTRLLVRNVWHTRPEECAVQTATYLQLHKAYHQAALLHCLQTGSSLVEVHSHRFGDTVAFSQTDWTNDLEKFPYVATRLPRIRHVTLVCSPTGAVMAHTWDRLARRVVRVREVRIAGRVLAHLVPDGYLGGRAAHLGAGPSSATAAAERHETDEPYQRQVLALGQAGQQRLAAARVGVVGIGGNGSVVALQLARMGVRRFVFIDPDVVERSNLGRLWGATLRDVGRLKVHIAAREVRTLHGDAAEVVAVPRSVVEWSAARRLRGIDVLVGATDSASARLAMALLSARYLLPYVDLGLSVRGEEGQLAQCFGQVQVALPGGPCLACLGGVDYASAAQELHTPQERAVRAAVGYGTRQAEAAAALAPINGMIASLGVLQVVAILTGLYTPAPYWYVDLAHERWLALDARKGEQCLICAEVGMGDLRRWPSWGRAPRAPEGSPSIIASQDLVAQGAAEAVEPPAARQLQESGGEEVVDARDGVAASRAGDDKAASSNASTWPRVDGREARGVAEDGGGAGAAARLWRSREDG